MFPILSAGFYPAACTIFLSGKFSTKFRLQRSQTTACLDRGGKKIVYSSNVVQVYRIKNLTVNHGGQLRDKGANKGVSLFDFDSSKKETPLLVWFYFSASSIRISDLRKDSSALAMLIPASPLESLFSARALDSSARCRSISSGHSHDSARIIIWS